MHQHSVLWTEVSSRRRFQFQFMLAMVIIHTVIFFIFMHIQYYVLKSVWSGGIMIFYLFL